MTASTVSRVRGHLAAVVVLELAVIVLAVIHRGPWYDDRPLLAVVFLLGMLAAPWAIVTPFLVAGDRPAAALLVVLLAAPFNLWLRYLGYQHGLADGKAARAWRAGMSKPWEDD